jgi:methionine aminopeptidase
VICASVNDAVVHGIPDDNRLRDGDLVSIGCGAELDGWTGDAAISFTVGTPRPADLELIDATRQTLDAGIATATVQDADTAAPLGPPRGCWAAAPRGRAEEPCGPAWSSG